MNAARGIEGRIRLAAVLILVGLAIEAITLRVLHPLSFIAFASERRSWPSFARSPCCEPMSKIAFAYRRERLPVTISGPPCGRSARW